MNDKDIACQIAAAERPHLGQPTTPPLAWKRLGPNDMSVVLADGRKVIRKIPSSLTPSSAVGPPSPVVGRPSSLTPEFKPVRKSSPQSTKKGKTSS